MMYWILQLVAQLVQQGDNADDHQGHDEDTQVTDAHDGKGFHQQFNIHIFNLQS